MDAGVEGTSSHRSQKWQGVCVLLLRLGSTLLGVTCDPSNVLTQLFLILLSGWERFCTLVSLVYLCNMVTVTARKGKANLVFLI